MGKHDKKPQRPAKAVRHLINKHSGGKVDPAMERRLAAARLEQAAQDRRDEEARKAAEARRAEEARKAAERARRAQS